MPTPDFEATADAFGLLADPVRVELLVALWQADDAPVAYSDLRDAVGLRDSGRFSYHLGKLTDHFVEKTEDGYRLRPSGMVVLNAVYGGSYVDAPTREGLAVTGSCPTCDSELDGVYDAGMFRIFCRECEDELFLLSFPPQGVERRDDEELERAVSLHARAHTRRANRGLCPFCGGSMARSLTLAPDTGLPLSTLVRCDCANCGVTNRSSVGFAILEHPAVAGFLHDCGVSDDAPPWRFDWVLGDDAVTVQSRDPPRVTIDVTAGRSGDADAGDRTLRVTVDEHGDVSETAELGTDAD